MCMRSDAVRIKRVRTEEEKRRRHLYGDEGAKFSSRRMALGGGIMNALTTVEDKDNLICEIIWI